MKKKYIFLTAAVSSLALTACEDMDTKPEGGFVTEEQKSEIYANDPSKTSAAVDGSFMKLSARTPNESSVGEAHNDFGYPSIMLFTDVNGEDVVGKVTGYNWFSHEIRFTDRSVSSYIAQMVWQDLYSYINGANGIVASVDHETTNAQTQFSLAQGYALRAFAYFQLAQLFQFNYVGHESSPCVPIVTDENAEEFASEGGKRATVQEVYDLIYSDIDRAIELLSASAEGGYSRGSNKYLVDLATAYGIRARVNLVTRKWAAAAADAESAISNSDAAPASIADVSTPTFWDIADNNWMWGIDVAETDPVVISGVVNFPSMIGSLNYGYANYHGGFQISKKLWASIPDTDVRKGWWLNEKGEATHVSGTDTIDHISASMKAGSLDYFGCLPGQFYAPLTNVKFGPYKGEVGTTTNANDVILMRIEEMYLIKAEAELMSGGNGLATLTEFVKTYRDPEYSYAGSDVHEEIWRQRRIELWGEGISWFDIMRLGTGINRLGTGHEKLYTFVMSGDDTKLLWPIPESEVQANKQLTEADYNPTSPTPQPVKATGTETIYDEKINM